MGKYRPVQLLGQFDPAYQESVGHCPTDETDSCTSASLGAAPTFQAQHVAPKRSIIGWENVASSDLVIREVSPTDRADWVDMWNGYCAFYKTAVSARVTANTWQRIVARDSAIRGLVAVSTARRAVGFANYVVNPNTWSETPSCYLEDLFVRPDARGAGIGAALIERLLVLGAENGWSRVYWMTQESNAVARRLYDRFTARDDFVRYTIVLGDRAEKPDARGV